MTPGARATVLALALGAAGTAAATPAQAAACSGGSGVTVVVDAGSAGRSTRCSPGDPADGLAALRGSGHSLTFVPRQPGFVCTVDATPATCNGAPSDAYWSYWHAQRGGSWQYSSTGAGSYDPRPGAVEGWAFGAGTPPRTVPPAALAAPSPSTTGSPSPRPTVSRPSAVRPTPAPARTTARPPGTRQPVSPTTAASARPVPSTTSATRPVPRATTAPARASALPSQDTTAQRSSQPATGSTAGGAATSPTTTPGAEVVAQASATPSERSALTEPVAASSSAGRGRLLLAGALVLAVAIAAWVTARRRRSLP